MADVYFTWFGPPQQMNKTVEGVGAARPDLFGLLRTAKARFPGGRPPPNFTLCCLKKFEAEFRSQLPDYISTLALEDAFPATSHLQSIILTKPDLTNLDLSVDCILRTIIGVRGTGYANSALPYPMLAFAKDLWSLYTVWKRGGYHIDAGCFPDAKYGGTVNLPEPTRFGVPVVSGEGKVPLHAKVPFPGGGKPFCATLAGGWAGMNGAVANMTMGVTVSPQKSSHMNRQVDVWLLRAPRGDAAAETALRFYIQGWFAMRDSNSLIAESYRQLVVSAVATGITHAGPSGCSSPSGWKDHLIEANGGDVPSLGLRKVGFQSHAH